VKQNKSIEKRGKKLALYSQMVPSCEIVLPDIKKIPFIFDPGQQIIQFTKNQLRKAIKQASVYMVNDYELSLTQKITGFDLPLLLRNSGVLITTYGAKGSTISIVRGNKSEKFEVNPAKAKNQSDPTGAGDAFRSGIIKGIIGSGYELIPDNYFKFPWLKIGQMGSLAAVYTVENYGTQTHKYTLKQFASRFKKEFNRKM